MGSARRVSSPGPGGAVPGPGGGAPSTPSEIRSLLERRGLRPHRERGQNFLADARVAERLADAAGVGGEDTVLEIGPGLGILTRALAARARRVVAVEVDAGLVRALREEGLLPGSVELVHADALVADLAALLREGPPGPRRVVANLPYAVASPLLRRILDLAAGLAGWAVLVQREVAQRLVARPGGRDFGSLSVLHALAARGERALDVHPRCFHPVPQVVSSLVRFTPLPGAPGPDELRAVERVARAGFGQRRKTLRNALRSLARERGAADGAVERLLAEAGVDPEARAETLAPEAWLRLARAGEGGLGTS